MSQPAAARSLRLRQLENAAESGPEAVLDILAGLAKLGEEIDPRYLELALVSLEGRQPGAVIASSGSISQADALNAFIRAAATAENTSPATFRSLCALAELAELAEETVVTLIRSAGKIGDISLADRLYDRGRRTPPTTRELVHAHLYNAAPEKAIALIECEASREPDRAEALVPLCSLVVRTLAARNETDEARTALATFRDFGIPLGPEFDSETDAVVPVESPERASALELLSDILLMVVHELVQPLRIIITDLELAGFHARAQDTDRLIELVSGRLPRKAEFLLERLEVYKAVARRPGSESTDISCEPGEIIDGLRRLTDDMVAASQVALDVTAAPEVREGSVRLAVDPLVVALACRQLVGNSLQALVQANRAEPRIAVTMSLSVEDDVPTWLDLKLSDNGGGIPPDVMRRVLDYGFTTKGGGGLGMGLSLAQSVTEHYGGKFTIASNREGTTVAMRFPTEGDESEGRR